MSDLNDLKEYYTMDTNPYFEKEFSLGEVTRDPAAFIKQSKPANIHLVYPDESGYYGVPVISEFIQGSSRNPSGHYLRPDMAANPIHRHHGPGSPPDESDREQDMPPPNLTQTPHGPHVHSGDCVHDDCYYHPSAFPSEEPSTPRVEEAEENDVGDKTPSNSRSFLPGVSSTIASSVSDTSHQEQIRVETDELVLAARQMIKACSKRTNAMVIWVSLVRDLL